MKISIHNQSIIDMITVHYDNYMYYYGDENKSNYELYDSFYYNDLPCKILVPYYFIHGELKFDDAEIAVYHEDSVFSIIDNNLEIVY